MIATTRIATAFALVMAPLCQEEAAPRWTQTQLEAESRSIQAQVEALRGARFQRPVKVEMADVKGFLEYARKREEQERSPERAHRDEAIAKLLGLVAPDLDLRALELELLQGQVGGFYDPGTSTFYLMDSMRGGLARVILAHELTHALDDQLYDIDATLDAAGGNTDAELAFRAVVEGSGSNAMNRWMMAHGRELTSEEVQQIQSMGAEALKKSPPMLWKPWLATYLAGEAFLVRTAGLNLTMAAAQSADIERAFRAVPRSTEQILHPEKYWDPKAADEPVEVTIDAADLPEGWEILGEDTLGELALALLTTPPAERRGFDPSDLRMLTQIRFTNRAAEGWGGDRALLLGRGADRGLVLRTVWDTPKDADEFAEALERSAPRPWGDRPREASAGWRAGLTPTEWNVTRGEADGRAWVEVRVWSR